MVLEFICIIIPYLPEFMLHSSSGMKDEQLRESHTSYKIVESASQPVTCSEIYIKSKHIEKVITVSTRWEISPGTHIQLLFLVLIWCRFTDRSQEFLSKHGYWWNFIYWLDLIFMWFWKFIQHGYLILDSMWN